VKTNQPVYLNLFKIKLPLTGIVSLLHRVTGVVLVIAIPFVLYLLQRSLHNEIAFQTVVKFLDDPFLILFEVVLFAGLVYHLFAGIRFLLLDVELGLNKKSAKLSSWLVITSTVLSTLVFIILRVIL